MSKDKYPSILLTLGGDEFCSSLGFDFMKYYANHEKRTFFNNIMDSTPNIFSTLKFPSSYYIISSRKVERRLGTSHPGSRSQISCLQRSKSRLGSVYSVDERRRY